MFRSIALSIALLVAPTAYAVCTPEQPLKLAALDWESGQFTTAVLNTLLQDGYGCSTQSIPGTATALEAALVQNDLQIIAEQWVGRSPIIEKAINEKKVVTIGDTLKGGAQQGWYIPDYVQQAHPELKTVSDLPRFKDLFTDPENPKQARFLNCPSGWICEVFNTNLLKNTGVSAQFNNVHPGTGAALDAEISSAYEQKKPILFYYWQPTGLMAKYSFKPIQFPPFEQKCWDELLKKDSQTQCVSDFPASKLMMSVSAPFHKSHPELVSLI